MSTPTKSPAAIGVLGAALGLVFATLSTLDYARHLDRRLHDVHCSLIPGVSAGASEDNPCRAAMYSVYSAVFRGSLWGGIPIALFAVGAFAFFLGFATYLLLTGDRAPRWTLWFFAATGSTPLLVSLVMFLVSLFELGSLCKVCIGIYISSLLLALGAWLHAVKSSQPQPAAAPPQPVHPAEARATKDFSPWSVLAPAGCLALLAAATAIPSIVYAAAAPDERPYIRGCGKLEKPVESHGALVALKTSRPIRAATLFEDPLCPTCKAFHQRIVAEGAFEKLDAKLALFPLDSECNWMLSTPLHPGACLLSRAVICGGESARQVLEWAYDEQEHLAALGKSGPLALRAAIVQKWGQRLGECIDATPTKLRQNQQLHFAADNAIAVSTPQLFLGSARVCDEDTDLGLRYTLNELAPELLQ